MVSTVYIAAPYPLRDAAIAVMQRLEDAGFEVTSTWLKQEDKLDDAYARLDLADVDRADALVALNPPEWVSTGTGGRHVEFGYALARQKPIVMVGERANIFHYLREVQVVDDSDLVKTLRAIQTVSSVPSLDLVSHLVRQAEFSERTFGPGRRTAGVIDHIRKELREIEQKPDDLSEWIDVVILGFDGAWRAGHWPSQIAAALRAKQARNEARKWPDWRTQPLDKAIEHDRSVA
jgi:nucleoside 2-deoxyribosyltransferase